MGASREVHFAALAEPALLLALATLARVTGATVADARSTAAIAVATWAHALPALALVAMTFLVLELVENSRIPVDDPTTHLELTMIHEVMVLDHSGPDLALHPIRRGAETMDPRRAVRRPRRAGAQRQSMARRRRRRSSAWRAWRSSSASIESAMARYRLVHVPQFIVGAATLVGRRLHRPSGLSAMPASLATIHAVGLLTCFALLGTSRIGACIRWLSLQGILFSLVPVIVHDDGLGPAGDAAGWRRTSRSRA